MISICTCSINSKFETEMFIRSLHEHNPSCDFEIVLTHDDRVSDGSAEYFSVLQKEFPRLKIVRNTHEDTVSYLFSVIDYYDKMSFFTQTIRTGLRDNIQLFAEKKLFDHKKHFLWLTSGVLYNKAVTAAKGDILLITPSDFLYLFSLRDLENYVKEKGSNFYSSPHAVFTRISNQGLPELKQHIGDIHCGRVSNSHYRWDSGLVRRDCMNYPCDLSKTFLADFRRNRLHHLAGESFLQRIRQYVAEVHLDQGRGSMLLPGFHGFHVMRREAFERIGGFTEEFYGRAWADDRMTALGVALCGEGLPQRFSVAWCDIGIIEPNEGEVLGVSYKNWQQRILQTDPFWFQKPAPRHGEIYLHNGIKNPDGSVMGNADFAKMMPFDRFSPPVKLMGI